MERIENSAVKSQLDLFIKEAIDWYGDRVPNLTVEGIWYHSQPSPKAGTGDRHMRPTEVVVTVVGQGMVVKTIPLGCRIRRVQHGLGQAPPITGRSPLHQFWS
jgi:hypothetical protein